MKKMRKFVNSRVTYNKLKKKIRLTIFNYVRPVLGNMLRGCW